MEAMEILGKFDFEIFNPRTEDDGRRIRQYVESAPGFAEEHGDQQNRRAAELLGIELERSTRTIRNTVVTVGKNSMLDNFLAGSSFTQTGPYMGLTQASPTPNAADTMASHSGWAEAGNANAPTYTSPRKTCVWSAASAGSKALSAALSFAITSSGTVGGAFLVLASGAVTTIDSTAGTLFSCAAFSGGNQAVTNGATVNVSWSCAM